MKFEPIRSKEARGRKEWETRVCCVVCIVGEECRERGRGLLEMSPNQQPRRENSSGFTSQRTHLNSRETLQVCETDRKLMPLHTGVVLGPGSPVLSRKSWSNHTWKSKQDKEMGGG